MGENEAQNLVRTTQHALDDLNVFSAHHLRLKLAQDYSSKNQTTGTVENAEEITSPRGLRDMADTTLTVKMTSRDSGSTPSAVLRQYSPVLEVFYTPNQLPSTSSSSSPLASFIANQLQSMFAEEQAMIAYILADTNVVGGALSSVPSMIAGQAPQSSTPAQTNNRESRSSLISSLSPELAANLARRTTRSVKYAPTYHLTISLFTPGANPSSWDIEAAVAEYVSPLLESLSPISNFTIDTQVQLYASFSPSVQDPEYDNITSTWTLRKEDLSGFINAAEWPLSPSIGGAPTLNFILYVPTPSQTPLIVKDSGASSWLIPQWGGVFIMNPASSSANTTLSSLSKDNLESALLTFSHQLLSLLGVPQSPASLPLRLLTLSRVRAASLLLSASSTLGSLARLTEALPSISIPETVANSVDRTLVHLGQSCANLRDGKFHSALENARIAEAEAERGFFEKSMVGQVYFPDEHKVAVYLPLLGPVGVPLFMSALKEFTRIWRVYKQKRLPTN
jgi:phosphatidylinositol glycan class S